jgi:hypothetical protein
MDSVVPGVDPATYRPSRLHDPERAWPETNCYVDLLIEVMHATGHDPVAALGFTVGQDFEGDQFTFFKFPTADLRRLAGFEIQELAIFDSLERHALNQIARGRMLLVEVDAHYLPDTRGLTYRVGHSKTTVGINAIDPQARRMVYFHGPGLWILEGEDYDGIFGAPGAEPAGLPLFPYTEFVKFEEPEAGDAVAAARDLLRRHLGNRPEANPLAAYRADFDAHAAELAGRDPAYFHVYAFNTLRQFGANFELLSTHLDWLGENGEAGLGEAAAAAASIASGAKTMQFKLARAMARGRFDGLSDMIAPMVEAYDATMAGLDAWSSRSRPRAAA